MVERKINVDYLIEDKFESLKRERILGLSKSDEQCGPEGRCLRVFGAEAGNVVLILQSITQRSCCPIGEHRCTVHPEKHDLWPRSL